MAKQKKKRTKKYSGTHAKVSHPTVTRVSAANRNRFSQWWFERKRILKPLLIVVLAIAALVIIVIGLISLLVGL